jgi:hypothetical protein
MPTLRVFSLLFVALTISSTAHSSLNDSENNSNSDTEIKQSKFLKLGSAGEPLESKAKKWSCVADKATGLTWQKRDPTTALHGHDTYIWHQPEKVISGTPRAHPDLDWADSTCFGFNPLDASSFCNTSDYAERVNQSNYCGFSDWRLPTANELLTLVDPDRKLRNISPLIDTRFFPFHKPFLFWTSTVDSDGIVATVFSDDRVFANSERSDTIMVRLVRGDNYQD